MSAHFLPCDMMRNLPQSPAILSYGDPTLTNSPRWRAANHEEQWDLLLVPPSSPLARPQRARRLFLG